MTPDALGAARARLAECETSEHMPFSEAPHAEATPEASLRVDAVETRLIESALERAKSNKSLAARLLGLTRGQLYSHIEKDGLKA
ncbi:MAG TPA: helix-turn-helix domain-containing protein [Thermoanaerobaculia bacterium]|nr:helix-turn-helix domain-containing protein [Thermoanaerobaculia bacterium]